MKDYRRDELSFAIRLILGHKIPPPPSFSVGVETRIEADILLSEKEYRVVALGDKQGRGFIFSCRDLCGSDVTREYLYLTSHSYEQDLSDVFCGEEESDIPRFLKYANDDLYYSENELAGVTSGLSNIKAFRRYLRNFLDNFAHFDKSSKVLLALFSPYRGYYQDGYSVENLVEFCIIFFHFFN